MRLGYTTCATICLLLLQLAGMGQPAASQINCQIEVVDSLSEKIQVSMDCSVTRTNGNELTLTAIRFPNQSFDSIRLVRPELALQPHRGSQLVQVTIPAGLSNWRLDYEISGNTRRVPLFVPDGSWKATVNVEVRLSDSQLVEDSFPALKREGDRLLGEFGHFPGFLFLPLVGSDESPQILSIRDWVDLSVLLVIVAASLYWLVLRRRAQAELSATEDSDIDTEEG